MPTEFTAKKIVVDATVRLNLLPLTLQEEPELYEIFRQGDSVFVCGHPDPTGHVCTFVPAWSVREA